MEINLAHRILISAANRDAIAKHDVLCISYDRTYYIYIKDIFS